MEQTTKIRKPAIDRNLAVMRSAFLQFKFPILPYCEVKRGPSTKFNESFHIENRNTKITLNFWWRDDDSVSVCSYNANETNPFLKNQSIINWSKTLSNDEIVKLCNRYLS